MTDAHLKEIFTTASDEGKDKNGIIMALVTEGGLDVTVAVREYTKLAREAGLVLSPKERTDKINAQLDDWDGEWTDSTARKDLAESLADEYEISPATAMAHIKKYAEEHDIELPTVQRTSAEDMVAFVSECHEDGDDRATIVEKLQDEFGYTANSAASAYSRATRELGIATGRSGPKADISAVVTFIRENANLPKKDAVAKMVEELGYAESTAATFFTYLNFAKEYARQEMEAAGMSQAA